ncbi:dual specificity testis-specific protein kinase 1 isoform X2 [Bombina bombina]|nr:dual specificity testis-specific protein kinase 1 isoform X2 [Bombina bombina]
MVLKMNKMMSNRANMLREVQLMNRLCHPNILRFMGVCVHQGQLHALTEYINGGNLEQLLQSSEPLSWSVRIKLSLDIARGLRYLHSKGVFHRDLTSKNCLVRCEDGRFSAVVGDFGLAEKIPDSSQTEPLSVVGSPYWMAPEVLRGDLYNEKADIFAFGIILCEIIARIPADPDYLPRTEDFGLDTKAFREMVQTDCPSAFLQLAFHCCRMAPDTRPSFLEVSQRLEGILEHVDRKKVKPPLRNSQSQESELIIPKHGRKSSSSNLDNSPKLWDLPTPPDQRLSRSQSDMLSLQPSHMHSQDSFDDILCGTPARVNPFSQREDLKGGRIKLFDTPSKSVISLTFDLPQPSSYQLNSPVTPEPISEAQGDFSQPIFRSRRCRSLPSSPEIFRRGNTLTPTLENMDHDGAEIDDWPPVFTNSKKRINDYRENNPKLNGGNYSMGVDHLSDSLTEGREEVKSCDKLEANGKIICGEDRTSTKKSGDDEWIKINHATKKSNNESFLDCVVKSTEVVKWNGDWFEGISVPQKRSQGWTEENHNEISDHWRGKELIMSSFEPDSRTEENKLISECKVWSRHWNQDTEVVDRLTKFFHVETGEAMDCSSSPDSTEENTFCQRSQQFQASEPFLAISPLHSSSSLSPSSSRSPSPPVSTWQQERLEAPNKLSFSVNNNVVCSKPLGWVGLIHPQPLGSLEGNLWEGNLPVLGCEGVEHESTAPLHASTSSIMDHEETVSCPACCLGGFSFISVCRRTPPDSSRYQNLNSETSRGLIHTAPRLSTPRHGPSRKLPEAQT